MRCALADKPRLSPIRGCEGWGFFTSSQSTRHYGDVRKLLRQVILASDEGSKVFLSAFVDTFCLSEPTPETMELAKCCHH